MMERPAYADVLKHHYSDTNDPSFVLTPPALTNHYAPIRRAGSAVQLDKAEFSRPNGRRGARPEDTISVTPTVAQAQAAMIKNADVGANGTVGAADVDALPIAAASLPPLCGPSGLSSTEIAELIVETAREQKIDENLALAIAFVESGFDRQRNSPKGARGVMQLMPATAARFGVSDVCDPHANIAGGTHYLRVLHEEFGNPLIVAAAYNAGEARIYEYGGIPPFAETVSYVAKVINYQLGFGMPQIGKTKLFRRLPRHVDEGAPKTGVLPVSKGGKFTGGVMHF
ncbi:lytic transglycosylase domain-containing protein [Aliirhizobium smilacinae]|uniref:Lytic transglycosylase domain-containing protein n=2 Tax=Aliirhizobium smilacinae TaxID=1395944 RepID=A0A5C4XVI4_9HYPH|nr:lytic transglycosylase domain-containing protein [Rhizobium smilacinae]